MKGVESTSHNDNDIKINLTNYKKTNLPYSTRLYLHFFFKFIQLPESINKAMEYINEVKNLTYEYPEYYSIAVTLVYLYIILFILNRVQ